MDSATGLLSSLPSINAGGDVTISVNCLPPATTDGTDSARGRSVGRSSSGARGSSRGRSSSRGAGQPRSGSRGRGTGSSSGGEAARGPAAWGSSQQHRDIEYKGMRLKTFVQDHLSTSMGSLQAHMSVLRQTDRLSQGPATLDPDYGLLLQLYLSQAAPGRGTGVRCDACAGKRLTTGKPYLCVLLPTGSPAGNTSGVTQKIFCSGFADVKKWCDAAQEENSDRLLVVPQLADLQSIKLASNMHVQQYTPKQPQEEPCSKLILPTDDQRGGAPMVKTFLNGLQDWGVPDFEVEHDAFFGQGVLYYLAKVLPAQKPSLNTWAFENI